VTALGDAVLAAVNTTNWSELSRRTGLSTRTIRALVNGEGDREARRDTVGKLDAPLGWTPGTAWALYRKEGSARVRPARGWWGLCCWNGLSEMQQLRLIKHGNLPIDYQPEGSCPSGAEVEITTMYDVAPGPRFYCVPCAGKYLETLS
jgi:hypothetical protein